MDQTRCTAHIFASRQLTQDELFEFKQRAARILLDITGSEATINIQEGSDKATELEDCPACQGSGWWEAACCSGANGCSCEGDYVNMGKCLDCSGSGVIDQYYKRGANIASITGKMYIGSGPQSRFDN